MTDTAHLAVYPSLRDRVVLVTGGATGIGATTVELFALQGARVAFVDVQEEAGAALVGALAPRAAHAPLFVPCDVTDVAALQAAIAEVARRAGPVRVLVNNAANDDRHPLDAITPAYFDERIAVNLRHHLFAAQAVAPGMAAAGGGAIVNMSSISWLAPPPDLHVYVAAKAAIVGLTRSLAHELGPRGIRVNAVMPGAIFTERQKRLWITEENAASLLARQCLKRHLVAEDVARLVLFLAADDSAAITCQTHVVDGGLI